MGGQEQKKDSTNITPQPETVSVEPGEPAVQCGELTEEELKQVAGGLRFDFKLVGVKTIS